MQNKSINEIAKNAVIELRRAANIIEDKVKNCTVENSEDLRVEVVVQLQLLFSYYYIMERKKDDNEK